jgi:hypothetical protein
LRLYDLRHSAATIALAAGVSPKVVSEQLGHARTAFTFDTYAHVLPHMQDEATARDELANGCTKPLRCGQFIESLEESTRQRDAHTKAIQIAMM